MKVFITGIAGFIGSHLAEKLIAEGYEVSGIDNFSNYYNPKIKRNNAEVVSSKGAKVHEDDLLSDNLSNYLNGVDFVFHLAAQPGNSQKTPLSKYVDNNIYATDKLISAIKENKYVKFLINIATSSIYGHEATSSEELPAQPVSPYGVTKLAAEQLVLANVREGHINACSLRLFSVFGPRERTDKLFPKLFDSALTGSNFTLFEGSLEHERSYTYIVDAINGIYSAMVNRDKLNYEILNVGSNIPITTKEAVQAVEEVTGKKINFDKLPKRPGDQLKTCACIDKASKLIDYKPKFSLFEGVKNMYETLM